MISTPSPPQPQPPGPPPNPPMFAQQNSAVNAAGQGLGAQINPSAGFGATILGNTNPTNTGQKTLLGQ